MSFFEKFDIPEGDDKEQKEDPFKKLLDNLDKIDDAAIEKTINSATIVATTLLDRNRAAKGVATFLQVEKDDAKKIVNGAVALTRLCTKAHVAAKEEMKKAQENAANRHESK